jgi:periplasmic copper chaperone A
MVNATLRTLIVLAFAMLPLAAKADSARIGDLVLSDAWSRATPPTANTGVAYVTVSNQGGEADRLVAVEATVAARAEMHMHLMDGDIARMRPVQAVDVPPSETIVFRPGGLHIMLVDLKAPLKEGEGLPLTLVFERSGRVRVDASIGEPGAMGPRGR